MLLKNLLLGSGLFFSVVGFSQADTLPGKVLTGTDTVSILHILRAGRLNVEKIDSVTTLQSLAVDVLVRQGTTLFGADSAVINQFTSVLEAFGNIHINESDTLHTYARYLRYLGKEKKAFLKTNVRLVDNKGGVLTTPELEYDMNARVATYKKGGKVVNKKTILTSKEGEYYQSTKEVVFRKDVVLNAPDYNIFTDSLLYNTQTEVARFIAPTTIINGNRKIYTKDGYYDLKTGKAFFSKRPLIVDSGTSILADDIAFDDKEGLGQFKGNVVYIDSVNGISILSNQLYANKKEASFLATEKPLMIIEQDKDSLYITADTLFSGKITGLPKDQSIPILKDTLQSGYTPPDLLGKDSSMNRFFQAWHNVRMFGDSVQAVCDSLFYAGTDSIFRLYRSPVLWGNDSQITADTIYLFTKEKKADRITAFFNGFIINKVAPGAFNQVKGNTVNAWFKGGNISYVRAKGRAETVYYAQDEKNQFVGMNRANSDAIDMFFEDRKANKVKFINDLKGVTYPIKQIPADEDRLRGFSWQENRRPKTRFEMFGQ